MGVNEVNGINNVGVNNVGVNVGGGNIGLDGTTNPASIEQPNANLSPENPISQNLLQKNAPQNDLPPQVQTQVDFENILKLVKLVYQYASENSGKSSELEKLVSNMEQIMEGK